MRYYQGRHPFYCGVDLHARKMYVSVIDEAGTLVQQRNLDAGPERFLSLIRPYRRVEFLLTARRIFPPQFGKST